MLQSSRVPATISLLPVGRTVTLLLLVTPFVTLSITVRIAGKYCHQLTHCFHYSFNYWYTDCISFSVAEALTDL